MNAAWDQTNENRQTGSGQSEGSVTDLKQAKTETWFYDTKQQSWKKLKTGKRLEEMTEEWKQKQERRTSRNLWGAPVKKAALTTLWCQGAKSMWRLLRSSEGETTNLQSLSSWNLQSAKLFLAMKAACGPPLWSTVKYLDNYCYFAQTFMVFRRSTFLTLVILWFFI